MPSLKDLPAHDRPRERLLREGPAALSDVELLALIIGNGRPGENALGVAQQLLARYPLARLEARSWRELVSLHGIGPATAARILAAAEIGRRGLGLSRKPLLDTAARVTHYVRGRHVLLQVEELWVLAVDRRRRLLGEETVGRGEAQRVAARTSGILRVAIRFDASGIILVHNHPGGDPSPSDADIVATHYLYDAAKFVGIELVDHVIISDNNFISLQQSGFIQRSRGMRKG